MWAARTKICQNWTYDHSVQSKFGFSLRIYLYLFWNLLVGALTKWNLDNTNNKMATILTVPDGYIWKWSQNETGPFRMANLHAIHQTHAIVDLGSTIQTMHIFESYPIIENKTKKKKKREEKKKTTSYYADYIWISALLIGNPHLKWAKVHTVASASLVAVQGSLWIIFYKLLIQYLWHLCWLCC